MSGLVISRCMVSEFSSLCVKDRIIYVEHKCICWRLMVFEVHMEKAPKVVFPMNPKINSTHRCIRQIYWSEGCCKTVKSRLYLLQKVEIAHVTSHLLISCVEVETSHVICYSYFYWEDVCNFWVTHYT